MKAPVLLVALLLVSVLSGCLGAQAPSQGKQSAPSGEVANAPPPTTIPPGAPGTEPGSAIPARKVVKTAQMSIEVESFETAVRDVGKLAEASGGFVSKSDSRITETGHKKGTITIRVPEGRFLDTVEELKKLGTVQSTTVTGEDVTEEYVDLDARLKNQRIQEERVQEILKKANTIDEILKVEGHLTGVRGEIERIEGRMRYLDNVASLSTITLELFEPEPPAPIVHVWGLRKTLGNAVVGFIETTNTLIEFTGRALPLAIFLVILYVIYRRMENLIYRVAGTLKRKKPEEETKEK